MKSETSNFYYGKVDREIMRAAFDALCVLLNWNDHPNSEPEGIWRVGSLDHAAAHKVCNDIACAMSRQEKI